jgi:hypothetical protein
MGSAGGLAICFDGAAGAGDPDLHANPDAHTTTAMSDRIHPRM